jgi:hypothetical protein
MRSRSWLFAVGFAAVVGCASGRANDDYVRSPSLDYGRERPRGTDDRPFGAMAIDPEDQLQQGARVGNDSELAPGWSVTEEHGLVHEPEHRRGGYGATSKQQEQVEQTSGAVSPE